VGGAGLNADFAQTLETPIDLGQGVAVPGHEGVEFLARAVPAADFADLAADADGGVERLQFPDISREGRRQIRVQVLLLGQSGQPQIHQRRGVDVDVEEAGCDGVADQQLDGRDFDLRIFPENFRLHLEMIALQEQRSAITLPDGRRLDDRRVLRRPLQGVVDLGTGDFEDHRADLVPAHGLEDGPGGVERHPADVDGRDGELEMLALAFEGIQVEQRRRVDPQAVGRGADGKPAVSLDLDIRMKHRVEDQRLDQPLAQRVLVKHLADTPPVVLEHAVQRRLKIVNLIEEHATDLQTRVGTPPHHPPARQPGQKSKWFPPGGRVAV